jgi:hypothetical protein
MGRYVEGPAAYLGAALAEPTARGVIEALLRGSLKMLSDPRNPRGCMSIQSALACGTDSESVKNALLEWRKQGEAAVRKRMKRAQAEGDLPKDVNTDDLTRYVAMLLNGLGVQAANGASKAEMTRVVEMALRTLPL